MPWWSRRQSGQDESTGGANPRVDEPIVPLMTAPNEPMASYWRELLGEAGIQVLVKPAGAGFGGWGSAATLEHELHVLRSDLPAARALIEAERDQPVASPPSDADLPE